MKCDYCGTEISKWTRFCPFCGTRQIPVQEHDDEPAFAPEQPPVLDGETFTWQPFQPKATLLQDAPEDPEISDEPSVSDTPRIQLPTRRSLTKMVFLGMVTLGIYPLVIWSRMVTELNLAASRSDGARTMPYFAMLWLVPLTLGIYPLVWFHRFSRRVGLELRRRGIDRAFGARDFWLWEMLGSLILVGPFVYVHRLTGAMNAINADFNARG